MEVAELNQRLAALTDHERGYRDGTLEPEWATDFVTPNDFFPLVDAIYIRKHSRFCATPLHRHDNVEINYMYTGSCPQHIDGRDITITENQVLLLDTGSTHCTDAVGRGDIMISIQLHRSFLEKCLMEMGSPEGAVSRFLVNALAKDADHRHYILFNSQNNRRIRRFFQELLCEHIEPSANAEQIKLNLFRLILMELLNVYEADYTQQAEEQHQVSVVPIIRYIEQNYQTCTQKSVAKHFFISPNYVNTLLKRHTGMTYMQAVQAQRLAHAATLLRTTNRPVEDIARECGYENRSFFYKKFAASYGKNPGDYRKSKHSG